MRVFTSKVRRRAVGEASVGKVGIEYRKKRGRMFIIFTSGYNKIYIPKRP